MYIYKSGERYVYTCIYVGDNQARPGTTLEDDVGRPGTAWNDLRPHAGRPGSIWGDQLLRKHWIPIPKTHQNFT